VFTGVAQAPKRGAGGGVGLAAVVHDAPYIAEHGVVALGDVIDAYDGFGHVRRSAIWAALASAWSGLAS
jgi:hypothetical protein